MSVSVTIATPLVLAGGMGFIEPVIEFPAPPPQAASVSAPPSAASASRGDEKRATAGHQPRAT